MGLVRRFLEHSRRFLARPKAEGFKGRKALLLTGASFAPVLDGTLEKLNRKTGSRLRAAAVDNLSFGSSVTVAGLLCGKDLQRAAEADRQAHGGRPDWVDAVVVPSSALRTRTGPTDQYTLAAAERPEANSEFLDDVTLAGLSRELGVPVVPSGENLAQLLENLEKCDSRS